MNLTLSIDDVLLKEARKAALDKDTTVNSLIRDYLTEFVEKNHRDGSQFLDEWRKLMDENAVDMTDRTWSRDDLHER